MADIPAWHIALAAAGVFIILLLLVGTLLGLIDWTDNTGTRS